MNKKNQGFTLIEVMLALVIISIAYLALLSALTATLNNTQRIEEKSEAHWVALNAINLVKLNLIKIHRPGELVHEKTVFLKNTYYWNAKILKTPIPHVEKILIEISTTPSGPFYPALSGFRYAYK